MAVVFISPKRRQKVFFMAITAVFSLLLIIIASIVFFSQPKPSESQLVFNKPKVNINFGIFDTEDFKNLKNFGEMDLQFTYTAATKDGKKTQGLITAVSLDEARKLLESMSLSIISIQEAEIGRENPFIPYYTETVAPTTTTSATGTNKTKTNTTTTANRSVPVR